MSSSLKNKGITDMFLGIIFSQNFVFTQLCGKVNTK